MSEHDYQTLWYIYLAAAALGYLAGWQLTAPLWRWIREPIRLAAAVLLFTPTLIDAEQGLQAPALAVLALDLAFGAGSSLLQAVMDLLTVGTLVVPAYLVFVAARWFWTRKRQAKAAEPAPAPAVEEPDFEFNEATFAEILQNMPEPSAGSQAPRH